MQADHPKNNVFVSLNKSHSLSDFILNYSYQLLFSADSVRKTKKGFLLKRKDARTILANCIKIDRMMSEIIIIELEKRNFLNRKNRGLYLKQGGREYE